MSEPIQITEEMRRAVMQEMCDTQGHLLSTRALMFTEPTHTSVRVKVGSPDAEKLPHLSCDRCGKTWVLIEEPGEDYDDAEMKLRDRMYAADRYNKRPERPRRSKK